MPPLTTNDTYNLQPGQLPWGGDWGKPSFLSFLSFCCGGENTTGVVTPPPTSRQIWSWKGLI